MNTKYKIGDVIVTKEFFGDGEDDECIARVMDVNLEDGGVWYHIEYLNGTYPYGDTHPNENTNSLTDTWIKGYYEPIVINKNIKKFSLV